MNYSVIIPTLNGGALWEEVVVELKNQVPTPDQVLVMDSESSDHTLEIAQKAGFRNLIIPKSTFDHGATRQKGLELLGHPEIVVFMTQDCILRSENAIASLLKPFSDELVAVAFGRQLARPEASDLESLARLFNYPPQSRITSIEDIPRLGVKAAFTSNVLSAYRSKLLNKIGGFPAQTIISEDMLTAARMVLAGYKIAYVAEAECIHSHNYTIMQEFNRAFDIGVFHHREAWLAEAFGHAESEGGKFVKFSLAKLGKTKPWLVPFSVFRFGMRYLGFKLGYFEHNIPHHLKSRLSMNKGFWKDVNRHHSSQ